MTMHIERSDPDDPIIDPIPVAEDPPGSPAARAAAKTTRTLLDEIARLERGRVLVEGRQRRARQERDGAARAVQTAEAGDARVNARRRLREAELHLESMAEELAAIAQEMHPLEVERRRRAEAARPQMREAVERFQALRAELHETAAALRGVRDATLSAKGRLEALMLDAGASLDTRVPTFNDLLPGVD